MENWRKFLFEKYLYAKDMEDAEETYIITIDDRRKQNYDLRASDQPSVSALGTNRRLALSKIHDRDRKLYFLENWVDRDSADKFIRSIETTWKKELVSLHKKIKDYVAADRIIAVKDWYAGKIEVYRNEFANKDPEKNRRTAMTHRSQTRYHGSTKKSYDWLDRFDTAEKIFKNQGLI